MKATSFLLILISLLTYVASPVLSQVTISGGSDNDIIGRTCRMLNGTLITVIERNANWDTGDFYVSFSTNNGDTWSSPTAILSETGNQSTFSLILSPDDSLRLFYASNESGIYKIYSISSYNGLIWTNKTIIELGWIISQEIYDPVVIVEEDSSFTMSYIKMGGGTYIANCPYGGNWDQNLTLVQSGVYRSRICKNTDGTYLMAYHRNISGNYDIHVKTSSNRINWSSEIDLTSNGNSHDAFCNITPDGKYIVYYSKVFPTKYNIHRRISDDGINWQTEEIITTDFVENTQSSFFIESNIIYLTWTHAVDYATDNDIYFEKFNYTPSNIERESENKQIEIFCNNHNNQIEIIFSSQHENVNISVSNISARNYFIKYYDIIVDNKIIINTKAFKPGIYFVKIITKKEKTVKKIIL